MSERSAVSNEDKGQRYQLERIASVETNPLGEKVIVGWSELADHLRLVASELVKTPETVCCLIIDRKQPEKKIDHDLDRAEIVLGIMDGPKRDNLLMDESELAKAAIRKVEAEFEEDRRRAARGRI